jgi:hypothetical protein
MTARRGPVTYGALRVRRVPASHAGEHGGAVRRVNFDNPPLKGSCRYTSVYLRRSREESAI